MKTQISWNQIFLSNLSQLPLAGGRTKYVILDLRPRFFLRWLQLVVGASLVTSSVPSSSNPVHIVVDTYRIIS